MKLLDLVTCALSGGWSKKTYVCLSRKLYGKSNSENVAFKYGLLSLEVENLLLYLY